MTDPEITGENFRTFKKQWKVCLMDLRKTNGIALVGVLKFTYLG
jgi:hypothetical protein